jgi:hypothetical protein
VRQISRNFVQVHPITAVARTVANRNQRFDCRDAILQVRINQRRAEILSKVVYEE